MNIETGMFRFPAYCFCVDIKSKKKKKKRELPANITCKLKNVSNTYSLNKLLDLQRSIINNTN